MDRQVVKNFIYSVYRKSFGKLTNQTILYKKVFFVNNKNEMNFKNL